MKIVIIGGVAGGMSAATRLRRLMEDAEIIVFEKGPYVSFANCGLPYFVSGEIDTRESLVVQTPEALAARFGLDVRPHHEVIGINPNEHTVTVQTNGQIFSESYDRLILSPGAKPLIPPIQGIEEAKNAFSLRSIPDLDQIIKTLDTQAQQAVVIGAGFIGLEMAENLKKRGLSVTLIEKAPQVLPQFDEEMAAFIEKELKNNEVQVTTGQSVVAFEKEGKILILEDGTRLSSDLTILCVGVQPENSLALQATIKTGFRGGILVDEHYQTNQPDIYAVGDAIVVKQQLTNEDTLISLASPANRQGRQVADVIAGFKRKNKGGIGTAIVRTFSLCAASTGLSERAARQKELPISVVHINGKDHAAYYPGATELNLKLIFNQTTGEIYGAQGIGEKGVDKRIDILATAIKAKLSVFDLPELELTYSPPFGSAKDPVNMLGYVAMNLIEGFSQSVQWYELADELAKGKILLDVRTSDEQTQGRFPHSLNIPLNELRERLDELDKTKEYIVSCYSGLRSYIAERILKQSGFSVANLDGAFRLYQIVREEELIYV
ncbi:coenzyme A disulfide reductase [Enterococcus sp. AZ194]|uniref:FAD-dependent oxidoreductase n=1 Tax=Enterococcus sp. AZ194 TaxID=2774629 RepID=UPI003F22FB36